MKVTSILFTALVAVASVEAVATPNEVLDAEAIQDYCFNSGEPCSKMKRAAEAVAEAVAGPVAAPEADADARRHVWCWRPGQPCSKAKRDALALAEAFAEAHAEANPSPEAGKHSILCIFPLETSTYFHFHRS